MPTRIKPVVLGHRIGPFRALFKDFNLRGPFIQSDYLTSSYFTLRKPDHPTGPVNGGGGKGCLVGEFYPKDLAAKTGNKPARSLKLEIMGISG